MPHAMPIPDPAPIAFQLDGENVEVAVDPLLPLGIAIREALQRNALVLPCQVGACGACTVLLDKAPVLACLTATGLVDGRRVTTIQGLPEDDPVIAAFVDASAFQCGYCTPGFVLATHALLAERRASGQDVDRGAIMAGLAGNLCRCASYPAIISAVEGLAEDLRRG